MSDMCLQSVKQYPFFSNKSLRLSILFRGIAAHRNAVTTFTQYTSAPEVRSPLQDELVYQIPSKPQ